MDSKRFERGRKAARSLNERTSRHAVNYIHGTTITEDEDMAYFIEQVIPRERQVKISLKQKE